MNAILVTGSTGFLGSEFITEALGRGLKIIALARNNQDGSRVTSVVSSIIKEKAITGIDLASSLLSLNFNGDWSALLKNLKDASVELDAVYHFAANMSYSPNKVVQSFGVNQKQSIEFYHFINDHFPKTKQFFYISTAFTAGINPPTLIKEELHLRPELINSYQMSKWGAEVSLSLLSSTMTVPLTIVRPSIIVGDRHTGRYSGKSFGFYMFIKAFLSAKVLGIKKIRLDMPPDSSINIISIKEVVDSLLSLKKISPVPPNHIVHLTCEKGTKVSKVAEALKQAWDFDLIFSPPVSLTDKLIDKQIRPNKEFAQFGKWNFEVNAIKKNQFDQSKEFTTEELKKMFIYYEKNFSVGLRMGVVKKVFKRFSFKHKRTEA
jgi:nucleoside-diphosphate-sugar epimerase